MITDALHSNQIRKFATEPLWLLVRRWGRVGRTGRQGGQSLTMSFAARGEAEREQARLLTAKGKRGYR